MAELLIIEEPATKEPTTLSPWFVGRREFLAKLRTCPEGVDYLKKVQLESLRGDYFDSHDMKIYPFNCDIVICIQIDSQGNVKRWLPEKYESVQPVWCFDTVCDYINPDRHSYSCRNPFIASSVKEYMSDGF